MYAGVGMLLVLLYSLQQWQHAGVSGRHAKGTHLSLPAAAPAWRCSMAALLSCLFLLPQLCTAQHSSGHLPTATVRLVLFPTTVQPDCHDMRNPLRELLAVPGQGPVLLLDGALGTQLEARGTHMSCRT